MSGPATLSTSGRRRLVVVSNRLPFTVERQGRALESRRSSGGLVAALDPVLTARGGVWIGWPGIEQEAGAAAPGLPPSGSVRYRAVPLSGREVTQYYSGFANRTLWPLFHYFVARTQIDAATWRAYEAVNERFAEAASAESDDDSLVWVHDYQLLRVPRYLRERAPTRRIALFLHIPFPAYDVFRILPWSRSLMRGVLAADLVGVHVPAYAEHVLTCAQRLLGCEVDRTAGLVQFEGREVAVQAHPIGIDAAHVEDLARRAGPRRGPATPVQIIGLDRLDYTKGIHERLLAVERLLERHPAHRGHIEFTQVVVPSRERVVEYQALKRELDETVGRINGRFSDHGWAPIRYLVRHLSADELAGFYRHADVALVTPLRDGMNLVAKEYVAAQVDESGVLVLSEMAGAAEELQEALLVSPYDVDAVAESLHRALTMPADERRARMSALRDRVRQHTVERWVDRFLTAAEAVQTGRRPEAQFPVDRVRRRLEPWLAQRATVALFLDYDGTLTPIAPRPEDALLPEAMREVLREAARTPNLDMAIVSGRSLAQLRELVQVEGITLVGNHGFEIEGPGLSHRVAGIERFRAALERAAAELAALGVAGARVELKGATLSFHVRQVAEDQQRDAERRAEAILRRRRLHVTRGKRLVEGRPPVDWHKGYAVLHVLVHRHGADWPSRVRALYMGDDVTDEDAFRSLRGIGRSIRVGPLPAGAASYADYAVPDPDSVLQLVRWLAAGAFAEAVR